jgi:hypothetical protein
MQKEVKRPQEPALDDHSSPAHLWVKRCQEPFMQKEVKRPQEPALDDHSSPAHLWQGQEQAGDGAHGNEKGPDTLLPDTFARPGPPAVPLSL